MSSPAVKLADRRKPTVSDILEPATAFPFQELSTIESRTDEEVVQGVFGRESVNVIVGPPNTAKTFFATSLGIHVAAGLEFFGKKVRRGPVLYIAAEAPFSWARRAKVAAEKLVGNGRIPLFVVSAAPVLGEEIVSRNEAERVIATTREIGSIEGESVALIFLDTAAASMGAGDENGAGMSTLTQHVRYISAQTGAAVVVVHHPSKVDPKNLRGHSSLAGAADTIIALNNDEMTGVRTATITKSRDGAVGAQFAFELEVVILPEPDCFGDPRSTCIVKPITTPVARRKRPGGKAQESLLTELERRYRSGEIRWDEARIREAGRGIGLHRNSSSAAFAGLLKAGFLRGESSNITLVYPPEECT